MIKAIGPKAGHNMHDRERDRFIPGTWKKASLR